MYHTDDKTTPKEIRDFTSGLISLNTARIWLKGDRPKSKAAQAVLLLVARLKQGETLPLPELKPAKPEQVRQILPSVKETPIDMEEQTEIMCETTDKRPNIMPGTFKVTGEKVYFVGDTATFVAKYDPKAEYRIKAKGFTYKMVFDQSKTFGAFTTQPV